MKRLHKTLCAAFVLFAAAGAANTAQAQVNVNINVPAWGPAAPAGAQYYYIPELGGYYDLRAQHYVLLRNGRWMPVNSVGYDPRTFHPVVINYVGAQPWVNINEHKAKYPKGMPPGQAKKLYGGHPGNGNGKGHGNGHGKGKH